MSEATGGGALAIALHNLIAPYMDAEMARQAAKQAAAMAAKVMSGP